MFGQRAAVRFFYLTLELVWVCEINRIHHWCLVGTEKFKAEGPTFQCITRLAELSLDGGPKGWDNYRNTAQ